MGSVKSNTSVAAINFSSNEYCKNNHIIIGPGATCIHSNDENCCCPIWSKSNYTKFLLYPGCILDKDWINGKMEFETFRLAGYLYLNKFVDENSESRDELSGLICNDMHVILPKNDSVLSFDKDSIVNINGKTIKYIATSYFKNLYWQYDSSNNHKEGPEPGQYSFEKTKAPLVFNITSDYNKAILSLDTDNEFAKYDVKLWNECKLDEGKYSFNYYNKLANKGNYFNVDEAYKLFYDVNKDDKKLTINTNTIYFGLMGSNDKEIELDLTNLENKNKVYLYGDNSEFEGTLILPESVTDVFLNKHSIIKNIKHNEKQYKIVVEEDNKIHYYEVDGESIEEIKPDNLELTFN